MRAAVVLVGLFALAAFGGCDASKDEQLMDPETSPEGGNAMDSSTDADAGSVADDSGHPIDSGTDAADALPPGRGFQIVTPEIIVPAGQEITFCYYFRTPNTESMGIKRWASEMTPGTHHMIMYATTNQQGQPVDKMPPGTVAAASCGFIPGGTPSWLYAAQTPIAALQLPPDDGAGKPLAMEIAPNTAGFLQLHYKNPTASPLTARAVINAEALDAGAAYTKTATFVTYNNSISIPPAAVGDVESQTCSVPANLKFWRMSTHVHKQAVKTVVKSGLAGSTTVAFTSTDWEQPGAQTWMSPAFYTFPSNALTYECTYDNAGTNVDRTITTGDSAKVDESCMAIGYFFPATKPLICFNGLGPF